MIHNSIITEGTAEKAIIDLLLEHDKLKISKESLIKGSQNDLVFSYLQIKKYVSSFLNHDFEGDQIYLYVILDSLNFCFSTASRTNQVTEVKYFVTREEIESIQIHADPKWPRQFQQFKRNNVSKKPSDFFKCSKAECGLGISNIKKYDFVYGLWSHRIDDLVLAIKAVKTEMIHKNSLLGSSRPNNYYLADILK